MIIRAAQAVPLDVGSKETDIADARSAGIGRGGLDEARGAIDAHRLAGRSHGIGQALRAVAEATADVQNVRAGRVEPPREDLVAIAGEPGDQQVLEAREFLEQYRVPRFDDDLVFAHSDPSRCGIAQPSKCGVCRSPAGGAGPQECRRTTIARAPTRMTEPMTAMRRKRSLFSIGVPQLSWCGTIPAPGGDHDKLSLNGHSA